MTLPSGFQVTLANDTAVLGRGAGLVGGSPLTALRLSPTARRTLQGRRVTVTDYVSATVADRLLNANLALPDVADLGDMSASDLTVVVPVRDRADQLDRCLTSLAGLACVVVDDASLHPGAIREVARRHGATYHLLPRNVGPAGARNAGLRQVGTPYVAFVDSDVQVRTTDLLRLARHFADPAVILVGPRVVGAPLASQPRWFERYETRASSLTLGTSAGVVRPGAAVAWLPSACLVARADALGEGFDERLRVGEDVDLVWRLTDQGHRVRYDPDTLARHDTRATVRAWLGRKAYYGSGSAALATRHGQYVAPAVLSPSYAAAAALILLRHGLALPVAAFAVARGRRALQRALPAEAATGTLATRIAIRGLGWAVRQESALLLRHWWPAAIVAAGLSRHARRALVTAWVVDLAVVLHEVHDLPPRDLPAHFSARRLDDLAYGSGLWWGALRTRSLASLSPRWVNKVRSASRTQVVASPTREP